MIKMNRKRSVSSLLDDFNKEESSSSQPSTHRDRSISSIINKETELSVRPLRNTIKKVICNCPDCNGKLVNSRTKVIYESRYQECQDSQGTISAEIDQLIIAETSTSASARRQIEPIEQKSDDQDSQDTISAKIGQLIIAETSTS